MRKSLRLAIRKKNGLIGIIGLLLLIVLVTVSSNIQRTARQYDVNRIMINSVKGEEDKDSTEYVFEIPEKEFVDIVIDFDTSDICFIGDNRVLSMEDTVLTDVKFISLENGNAFWLKKEAIDLLDDMREIKVCVVALGINDMENAELYIHTLNSLANKCKDKAFIYINVGPINESVSVEYTNEDICKFNDDMLRGLNEKWIVIDQYSYLIDSGFTIQKDILYSAQDSSRLFLWLINTIKSQSLTVKTEA